MNEIILMVLLLVSVYNILSAIKFVFINPYDDYGEKIFDNNTEKFYLFVCYLLFGFIIGNLAMILSKKQWNNFWNYVEKKVS